MRDKKLDNSDFDDYNQVLCCAWYLWRDSTLSADNCRQLFLMCAALSKLGIDPMNVVTGLVEHIDGSVVEVNKLRSKWEADYNKELDRRSRDRKEMSL